MAFRRDIYYVLSTNGIENPLLDGLLTLYQTYLDSSANIYSLDYWEIIFILANGVHIYVYTRFVEIVEFYS